MRASFCKEQSEFCIVLTPNHQPVRLYMRLPITGIFPRQAVLPVLGRQSPRLLQQVHNLHKQRQIKTPLPTESDITPELPGKKDFVHYARHFLTKSVPFSAWKTCPAATSSIAASKPFLRGAATFSGLSPRLRMYTRRLFAALVRSLIEKE